MLSGLLLCANPTARHLLTMPDTKRNCILSEAAAHAALLYAADLTLPPEPRERTAISAIQEKFYEYRKAG
jgi:hypothetical protein